MLSVLAILSALAAAASWAVASIAIAKVLEGGLVSPAAANLFKNSVAAFCFLIGALVFGGHWPVGQAWAWLFLSGFLGFAISDTLYFAAFRRCGVQTAATVMLLNVPIATLLAVPLAGDSIETQVIPFIAVVLVGVVLVIVDSRGEAKAAGAEANGAGADGTGPDGAGSPSGPGGYGLGVLFAVVAAFAIGTAIPLGRGSFGEVSVCQGGFIRLVGGAVGAVPLVALMGLGKKSSSGQELSRLLEPIFAAPGPGSVWGRASLFGVGCAVLGLVPYHFAQRELPSGIASTLFSSTPLFTLPLAIFIGQRAGWKAILGTLAGFAGVAGILHVTQTQKAPSIQLDLGPGPRGVLISQEGSATREGGVRPSFVRAFDPEPSPHSFVALSTAPTVMVSGPSSAGSLFPVLFEPTEEGGMLPRTVLPPLASRSLARGHWADVPFAIRLATRGLLVGTHQAIGDDGLGFGVRLGLEADGPPGLDLGWLHVNEADVLHGFVSGVPLEDGGAQFVWIDDRDGEEREGMTLLRRQMRADGSLGREVVVDESVCDCCAPSLVQLEDGAMVVAYRHRALDNIRDIYLSRRDPRSGAWSEPAPVHEDGWKVEGCPVSGPAVAAIDSLVAVAWLTRATADGQPELRVSFSRDGGQTMGEAIPVVQGETLGRLALAPVLAEPGDERFVLVHLASGTDEDPQSSDASWRAGFVRPDGAVSEFALLADVPGTRASGRLDLIHLRPGVLGAAWTGPSGLVNAELRCDELSLPASVNPDGAPGATSRTSDDGR